MELGSWPRSERPRERLLEAGPQSLSDGELLAILLGTGIRGASATDVARRLKQHNSGKGARSTRGRAWTLLRTEKFRTRRQAMSREWYLKRDRKLRKTLAQNIQP